MGNAFPDTLLDPSAGSRSTGRLSLRQISPEYPFFFFLSGEYPFLTVYRRSYPPPPKKHILCGLTAKLWPIDCISCSINWRCSGSLIYGRKVVLVKTKVLGEMGVIECRLHELVVAIAGSNLEGGYSPDILLLKAQASWTSGSDSRVLSGGGYSPDIFLL